MTINRALMLVMTLLLTFIFTDKAGAIPVEPNLWKTITLTNGKTIKAQLIGDEWFSCFRDADGNLYTMESNRSNSPRYAQRTVEEIDALAIAQYARRDKDMDQHKSALRVPALKKGMKKTENSKGNDAFRGNKKGLIIMVNFQDKSYVTSNPKEHFNKVANQLNFKQGSYKLSIRDYFLKQSYGRFDLQFDVIGPVTVSENMAYYGAQSGSTHDVKPAAMVKEAIELVQDSVNFSDYDWDGNGEMENVFILYAGHNQAEGGADDTIWPHKWSLSSGGVGSLTLQGIKINTYACSSELRGSSGTNQCGIGTFCHEFSHCMGYPDLYDTSYSGNVGVGSWDIMSSGSYRGSGFNPIDYCGFERWIAGWLEPIELTDPVNVENMKPIESNGESYVIDCGSTTGNEYYFLENRSVTSMYGSYQNPKGLLITHIDYDYYAWYYNKVNTFGNYYSYNSRTGQWVTKNNQHMRWQIIPADNNLQQYASHNGDVYPYTSSGTTNNSLTVESTPKMVYYNGGETTIDLDDHGITNIVKNGDGSINFTYRGADAGGTTWKSLYFDERSTSEMSYDGGTYNVNTNVMFPKNQWRAVWFPFPLTRAELREALGNNVQIALFNNVVENSADASGKTEINFKTTTGDLPAFTPCIIKVSNTWSYTELGLRLQKQVSAFSGTPTVEKNGYVFGGVKKAGALNTQSVYVNNLSNVYPYAEDLPRDIPADTYIYAYDCVLGTNSSSGIIFTLDKVVTAIDGVVTDIDGITSHHVYDLNGNIVKKNAKTTDGLSPGVYIFHGKKVIVR